MSLTPSAEINFLEFWLQARDQELGVYIEVDRPDTFRNALYKARAESGELSLSTIVCFTPARGDVILLLKQSVELEG